MRIQPDGAEAVAEQVAVARLLRTVLSKAVSQLDGSDEPLSRLLAGTVSSPGGPELDLLCYPGFVAAAYDAQAARRAATQDSEERGEFAARLRDVAEQARSSVRRAQGCLCPTWRVDLAPPEPHLHDSLVRAVAQTPKRPGRTDELREMAVADWRDEQRATFCEASCLLAVVWPEMLAEMTAVVRQVALLQGYGIDGFTDFTTHGAVFVNSQRLEPGDDGLLHHVRLAEALVHEATHNRCNAAALSHPFLTDVDQGSQPLVTTPLRPDPRPLAGLFQQLVVLARCLVLYDRLLDGAFSGGQALRTRHERLLRQAEQAVKTAQRHSDRFTEHGRGVVAEAEDLLERQASGASVH